MVASGPQLSNGFIGCKRVLDKRAKLVLESRLISGSRGCGYESNSSDWLLSACCNPSLLYFQCCVPGDQFVDVRSIDESPLGLDTVSTSAGLHSIARIPILMSLNFDS